MSFERDLQLVDLKAELVWNRLGEIGEIRALDPPSGELVRTTETRRLQLIVASDRDVAELHQAADIGGVERVDVVEASDLRPASDPSPAVVPLPEQASTHENQPSIVDINEAGRGVPVNCARSTSRPRANLVWSKRFG